LRNYIYNFAVYIVNKFMRILKYLFLLIILFSIGLGVYIFTQKGDYQVSRSKVIKASKITVFEYVNDFKNWETFNAMKHQDPSILYNYSGNTSGIGASFSWHGSNGIGIMKTIYIKENDSISQKVTLDGSSAIVNWKFKDTIGGTKVTYSTIGKIGFMMKFKSFFKGGISRIKKNEYDRTLYNLEKTLATELKTYSVKVNGIAQRKAAYFLKQTFSCKTKSVSRNIKVVMSKLVYFFKKNNIPMAGKPFVIFNSTTLETEVITVSVCIPTYRLIAVMPGSDVSSGQMDAFTCIKTTLTGDYSHRKELWKKGQQYIVENKYIPNFGGKYVEIYTKTIDDVKNPSKWKTELYIPVYPKVIDTQVKPSTTIDTITEVKVSQPQTARPTLKPIQSVNQIIPKKGTIRKLDSVKKPIITPKKIQISTPQVEKK
jgi:effector-binding domain-containing protein